MMSAAIQIRIEKNGGRSTLDSRFHFFFSPLIRLTAIEYRRKWMVSIIWHIFIFSLATRRMAKGKFSRRKKGGNERRPAAAARFGHFAFRGGVFSPSASLSLLSSSPSSLSFLVCVWMYSVFDGRPSKRGVCALQPTPLFYFPPYSTLLPSSFVRRLQTEFSFPFTRWHGRDVTYTVLFLMAKRDRIYWRILGRNISVAPTTILLFSFLLSKWSSSWRAPMMIVLRPVSSFNRSSLTFRS